MRSFVLLGAVLAVFLSGASANAPPRQWTTKQAWDWYRKQPWLVGFNLKKHGRPLLCTEWMARLLGSRWETDLPPFKAEGVGCYNWGLVNGRTQANFSWRNKRGDPEPRVWFHDLFHADGRPYDPAEHEAIRRNTADKRLDWSAREFRQVQTPAPGLKPPQMLYGDPTRHGRPFAKDPSVVRFGQRYLIYYSMAPSADKSLPKGWARRWQPEQGRRRRLGSCGGRRKL